METFHSAEQARLGGVTGALSGVARRARSTIMGLKNYGPKVLWWLVSRCLDINPPSSRSLAMALAFLVDLRGNAAAAAQKAAVEFMLAMRARVVVVIAPLKQPPAASVWSQSI